MKQTIKNIFKNRKKKIHFKPYLIAEIGVNHECSLSKAKRMINQAKKGGADAVKFQAYKAELITSTNSPAYWDLKKEKTKSQYKLFKKFDKFGFKEFKILKKECDRLKIDFLCTPFDHQAAKYLNPLVKAFKISSSDITNFPLINLIATFKKPIILSTGASTFKEIKEAVKLIQKKNKKIILLHCVLNYPTKQKDMSLSTIKKLETFFPKYPIGYSDHSNVLNNQDNLIYAWLLGASVIEKHFTYDKTKLGNDHYHSMDWKDFIALNNKIKKILISYGYSKKQNLKTQNISRKNARRSIYAANDINSGTVLNENNIICKRPAYGLHPKYFIKLLGKKIIKDKKKDELIKLSDF